MRTLGSLDKLPSTRGYNKVRRLMQWNKKKYQLWIFKLDTLITNHFIIKYILYGMIIRRSLRWDPWRSTASLIFHVYFLYFNKLKQGTQESNTNLNNLFLDEYQIWWNAEWNLQCFTKRTFKINYVSIIRLKRSCFSTFTQRHLTMSRNNGSQ